MDRVRAVMNPVRDRLDAKVLAEAAVRLIDDADLAGAARPKSPLAKAFMEFDEQQHKAGKGSWEHDPNRFEMSLGQDAKTGRVLVLVRAERPEFRDAFAAMDEVAEYAYWNNADQPEGITESEWRQRKDAWNRVLPGAGVPADTMLDMRLRVDHFVGMLTLAQHKDGVHPLILDTLPTREQRARRLLRAARYRVARDSDDLWGMMRTVERGLPEVAADLAPLLSDITAADLTGSGTPADATQVVSLLAQDAKAFAVHEQAPPHNDAPVRTPFSKTLTADEKAAAASRRQARTASSGGEGAAGPHLPSE